MAGSVSDQVPKCIQRWVHPAHRWQSQLHSPVPVYLLWVLILCVFILFLEKECHLSNSHSIFFLPAHCLRLHSFNKNISNVAQSASWCLCFEPWLFHRSKPTEFFPYSLSHVVCYISYGLMFWNFIHSLKDLEFLLLYSVKWGSTLVFTDSCHLICWPSLPCVLLILISVNCLSAFILLSSAHCLGAHLELLDVGRCLGYFNKKACF